MDDFENIILIILFFSSFISMVLIGILFIRIADDINKEKKLKKNASKLIQMFILIIIMFIIIHTLYLIYRIFTSDYWKYIYFNGGCILFFTMMLVGNIIINERIKEGITKGELNIEEAQTN